MVRPADDDSNSQPHAPQYDIAISFLSEDLTLALKIADELQPEFSVFVYERKQKDLAGTDGMESFRVAFRSRSRLNVIRFRPGWGERGYTLVESTAIKERALKDGRGWRTLLVVVLEDRKALPAWVPETDISLDFSHYGLEQTLGAIKTRAREVGALPKRPNPVEMARAIAQQRKFEQERIALMESERGVDEATKEANTLIRLTDSLMAEIVTEVPDLNIRHEAVDNRFVGTAASGIEIRWVSLVVNSTERARLRVLEFDHNLILPSETGRNYRSGYPRVAAEQTFKPDFTIEYRWAWRDDRDDRLISTPALAESIVKRFLDTQAPGRRRAGKTWGVA